MSKLQLFLLLDGVVVVGGILFFLFLYLRRGVGGGHFKDDLWRRPPTKAEKARRAVEDKVDETILRLEHAPEAKEREPAAAKPEFRLPNFRGKPHEVLGIDEAADAALIGRAHKHWIKKYHPDRVHHLGAQYVDQARRRSEQINSARQEMLRRLALRAK